MSSTYSESAAEKGSSRIVPIEILGVSLTIRTDENPEYIKGLVAEFKERLSRVSSQMKIADPLKLSLVTALLVLDELRRDDMEKGDSEEREADSLLDDLDKRLGELGL